MAACGIISRSDNAILIKLLSVHPVLTQPIIFLELNFTTAWQCLGASTTFSWDEDCEIYSTSSIGHTAIL